MTEPTVPGARVVRRAQASVRLAAGTFQAVGYWEPGAGREQLALVLGDVRAGGGSEVLARVHSECLTGDGFGSLRCDCGPQLQHALQTIADHGCGVVVYARGHEGRGIGLNNKLRAYRLQDAGADTLQANLDLGLPADGRDYRTAAAILHDLGVQSVRLLSNNPAKRTALETAGVPVPSMVPLRIDVTEHNARYLATKRDRMGHVL